MHRPAPSGGWTRSRWCRGGSRRLTSARRTKSPEGRRSSTFAQTLALSVTSSRSQVEAAGGASGTKQPAVADTASRDAARLAPVPHALVLSSVALFLILLAGTAALSVQAYVLPERATSTTSAVAEAS